MMRAVLSLVAPAPVQECPENAAESDPKTHRDRAQPARLMVRAGCAVTQAIARPTPFRATHTRGDRGRQVGVAHCGLRRARLRCVWATLNGRAAVATMVLPLVVLVVPSVLAATVVSFAVTVSSVQHTRPPSSNTI